MTQARSLHVAWASKMAAAEGSGVGGPLVSGAAGAGGSPRCLLSAGGRGLLTPPSAKLGQAAAQWRGKQAAAAAGGLGGHGGRWLARRAGRGSGSRRPPAAPSLLLAACPGCPGVDCRTGRTVFCSLPSVGARVL